MMTDAAVFLLLFDNPGTALLISPPGDQHIVGQHEEMMGHGNDGALFAFCC